MDERGIAYDAADVDVLDITDEAKVDTYIAKNRPEIEDHCAAYTAVDKAEGECKTVNELLNAVGSQIMAKACKKYEALMVYVSTDYVFDGLRTVGVYMPDDPKGPRNEYGRTKLLGEQAIEKYCDKFYIFRTDCVYGKWGHIFV